MRDIKFRAWDKWKNQMIAPNNGDFIGWHAMSNWRDCLEVMQYTGLKDKNGRDIYEGDILALRYTDSQYPSVVGVVQWFTQAMDCGGGEYGMQFSKWTLRKYTERFGADNVTDSCYHMSVEDVREIIGNIYENPELLEAE